jgi:hypothetical protein
MNADGTLSMVDMAFLSSYIINDLEFTALQYWLGDCNFDDQNDVMDILMLSDKIQLSEGG